MESIVEKGSGDAKPLVTFLVESEDYVSQPRSNPLPMPQNLPTYPMPRVGFADETPEYKESLLMQGEGMGRSHIEALVGSSSSDDDESHPAEDSDSRLKRRRAVLKKSRAISAQSQFFLTASEKVPIRKDSNASLGSSSGLGGFLSRKSSSKREATLEHQMQLLGPLKYPDEFQQLKNKRKGKSVGLGDTVIEGSIQEGAVTEVKNANNPNLLRIVTNKHSSAGLHLKHRSNGLPGGLNFSVDEAGKYFGVQAKDEFYEKYHWMCSQREKASIDSHAPTSLLSTPSALFTHKKVSGKMPYGVVNSAAKYGVNSYAFAPVRAEPAAKISTKMLIRTQTLQDGESYSQMKVVMKPEHVILPDTPLDQSDNEDEDEGDEESDDDNDTMSSSDLGTGRTSSNGAMSLNHSSSFPSQPAGKGGKSSVVGTGIAGDVPTSAAGAGTSAVASLSPRRLKSISPRPHLLPPPSQHNPSQHVGGLNQHSAKHSNPAKLELGTNTTTILNSSRDSFVDFTSTTEEETAPRITTTRESRKSTPVRRRSSLGGSHNRAALQILQKQEREHKESMKKKAHQSAQEHLKLQAKLGHGGRVQDTFEYGAVRTTAAESILSKLTAVERNNMKSLRAQINAELTERSEGSMSNHMDISGDSGDVRNFGAGTSAYSSVSGGTATAAAAAGTGITGAADDSDERPERQRRGAILAKPAKLPPGAKAHTAAPAGHIKASATTTSVHKSQTASIDAGPVGALTAAKSSLPGHTVRAGGSSGSGHGARDTARSKNPAKSSAVARTPPIKPKAQARVGTSSGGARSTSGSGKVGQDGNQSSNISSPLRSKSMSNTPNNRASASKIESDAAAISSHISPKARKREPSQTSTPKSHVRKATTADVVQTVDTATTTTTTTSGTATGTFNYSNSSGTEEENQGNKDATEAGAEGGRKLPSLKTLSRVAFLGMKALHALHETIELDDLEIDPNAVFTNTSAASTAGAGRGGAGAGGASPRSPTHSGVAHGIDDPISIQELLHRFTPKGRRAHEEEDEERAAAAKDEEEDEVHFTGSRYANPHANMNRSPKSSVGPSLQMQRKSTTDSLNSGDSELQAAAQNLRWEHAMAEKQVEPLQMICIDHRDRYNRRIEARNRRRDNGNGKGDGSLFKYVEGRKANLDFYTTGGDESDSDDDVAYLKDVLQVTDGGTRSPSSLAARSQTSGNSKSVATGLGSIASDAASYNTAELKVLQGPISPRSQFIDSCIRKNLNPRASLLLRKTFTKRLNLQHHGMGDELAKLFAKAIINVPYIMSFNVADNNLTDAGLGPIVKAVRKMKDIVDLDLSYNTIGPEAASCLATYLASEDCPLERLVLRRADVDDGECERFVSALQTNRNLKELDLSENLVGSSENLNTVMPDLVTGGEALADLLRSEGCTLTCLKLGWNMIRLDGAADLMSSLKLNTTLTYLDVSFNSLGSSGGIQLGDALQDNKVLKTLLVANNSLDAVATLTICAGVLENDALERVVFDGNPIGEQGAKALMLLPTMVGSRVSISATGCNIRIQDPQCWFDSTHLVRKFDLKLAEPFDRAVALLIMYLIAAHQTFVIAHSEWFDENGRNSELLELEERSYVDFENKRLNAKQLEAIESLKVVKEAASDIDSARELFEEIDEDGSGQLDEEEFGNLLSSLGMAMTPDQVRVVMSEYDVDQGGVIELTEFLLFLRGQAKESDQKLKELTEFPIMCRGSDPPSETTRYVPPREGTLKLVIIDGFTRKETYRVLTDADRDYIVEIARQSGELLAMTHFGVQNYKMHFNEALAICETMLKENSSKTQVLAKVLPQMAAASEARAVVAKILGNNKADEQRLKREIGHAIKPMLGCTDGRYVLDLANPMDKFCLNKLLEYSMTIGHRRAKQSKLGYGVVGDCSQKGNWSGFRNELFNGRPVTVTTDFASPMPRSGRLEFDFVSEQRVGKDDFVLNDVRFTNMLVRLFQIRADERDETMERLRISRLNSERTLNGDAKTVCEVDKERSFAIGEAMMEFYENLPDRQASIDKFRMQEGVKVKMEVDPLTTILTYKNVEQVYNVPSVKDLPPEVDLAAKSRAASMAAKNGSTRKSAGGTGSTRSSLSAAPGIAASTAAAMKAAVKAATATGSGGDENGADNASEGSSSVTSMKPEQPNSGPPDMHHTGSTAHENWAKVKADAAAVSNVVATLTEGIELDEYMRRYVCAMASNNVHKRSKAARTLELLVSAFEFHHIMARHLELMLLLFGEIGTIPTSDMWGTYRVELVVGLFASVVDLHNFEIVMRALTPFEAACVICRIGWLHLYNPMKPEGHYQLDMSRREERAIVKTLAQLATAEPGDNLPFVQFRWEREMDPMPGYELTEPWLTEEGLPNKGLWDCYYYAGDGVGREGCKPYTKLRRAMLQLVLINEEEVVKESEKEAEVPPQLFGETFMMANVGIFYSYLAYNEEEFKRYQEKKREEGAAKNKGGKRGRRK